MIRKLGLGLISAVAGVCVMSAAQAMPTAQITTQINNNIRVTLAGNTRPEAIPANDRGAVSSGLMIQHAQLLLKRSAASEKDLETLIANLHDRKSPQYHKWLTAKQFGQRFGASDSDISKVSGWLSANGLKVDGVATGKMMITFSGTAGAVGKAFNTSIHNLMVNGVHHIANIRDPQIPAALANAVAGIVSLNDFKPHAYVEFRGKGKANFTGSCLFAGGAPCLTVTPADLATIYDQSSTLASGITGKGVTIVVIEDSGIGDGGTQTKNDNDWVTFRQTTGLSNYTHASFTQINPAPASGTNDCADPGINGDEGEATLDAEWASAAAPDANIVMASCADTITFGGLVALENLLNSPNPAPVVSMSYGECETRTGATQNAAFNTTFQQAVAEGTTVLVSSGDQSAAVCDRDVASARHGIAVNGWGSTVYNVSVGGTDFGDVPALCTIADLATLAKTETCVKKYWSKTNSATFGSAKSYIPEIPWDNSCANSTLATFVTGSPVAYGPTGFCNTAFGRNFLGTTGGSGGPSGCATGSPARFEVVSGGCKGYAKPAWQAGVFGNPADGVRDLPDVALFAANGLWTHSFVFCDSNFGGCTPGDPSQWVLAGGTSFSSPIMAGFIALIVQKTGSRQGDANVNLYALANAEYGTKGSSSCNAAKGAKVGASCVFRDVTAGDMDVNCSGAVNCFEGIGLAGVLSVSSTSFQPAYKTGAGWDFATGLGTVDVKNLVNKWPT
jgi:subtilase family serine protease